MLYGNSSTKHMTKLFIQKEIEAVNKLNFSRHCKESTCIELFTLTIEILHKVLP